MTLHVVSDDERREAAERIRGLKRDKNNVTQLNHGPTWSLAWCVLGDELDKCGTGEWFERMCARLADLIDPGDTSQGCRGTVAYDPVEPGTKLYDSPNSSNKESRGAREPAVDREALLALAEEMEDICDLLPIRRWAHSIREACGEVDE